MRWRSSPAARSSCRTTAGSSTRSPPASSPSRANGKVEFYEGDWSSWHARQAAQTQQSPAVSRPPSTPSKSETKKSEAKRKLSFKEKQELDGIEAAISTAESKTAALQAELEDPAIYKTRAAEVPAMVAALDAARAEVDRLYARWQELEGLR